MKTGPMFGVFSVMTARLIEDALDGWNNTPALSGEKLAEIANDKRARESLTAHAEDLQGRLFQMQEALTAAARDLQVAQEKAAAADGDKHAVASLRERAERAEQAAKSANGSCTTLLNFGTHYLRAMAALNEHRAMALDSVAVTADRAIGLVQESEARLAAGLLSKASYLKALPKMLESEGVSPQQIRRHAGIVRKAFLEDAEQVLNQIDANLLEGLTTIVQDTKTGESLCRAGEGAPAKDVQNDFARSSLNWEVAVYGQAYPRRLSATISRISERVADLESEEAVEGDLNVHPLPFMVSGITPNLHGQGVPAPPVDGESEAEASHRKRESAETVAYNRLTLPTDAGGAPVSISNEVRSWDGKGGRVADESPVSLAGSTQRARGAARIDESPPGLGMVEMLWAYRERGDHVSQNAPLSSRKLNHDTAREFEKNRPWAPGEAGGEHDAAPGEPLAGLRDSLMARFRAIHAIVMAEFGYIDETQMRAAKGYSDALRDEIRKAVDEQANRLLAESTGESEDFDASPQ